MRSIVIPLLLTALAVLIGFLIFSNSEVYFSELLNDAVTQTDKYLLISFLILSSDIVLPIPSSLIMYLNGTILGVIGGAGLSLVSSITSALIGYGLGKSATTRFQFEANQKTEDLLSKYGELAIIITRGIPILSESISITAGYHGMNFRGYVISNIIGYIPICLIYAYFGHLANVENQILISVAAAVFVAVLLWVLGKRLGETYFSSNEDIKNKESFTSTK